MKMKMFHKLKKRQAIIDAVGTEPWDNYMQISATTSYTSML